MLDKFPSPGPHPHPLFSTFLKILSGGLIKLPRLSLNSVCNPDGFCAFKFPASASPVPGTLAVAKIVTVIRNITIIELRVYLSGRAGILYI